MNKKKMLNEKMFIDIELEGENFFCSFLFDTLHSFDIPGKESRKNSLLYAIFK